MWITVFMLLYYDKNTYVMKLGGTVRDQEKGSN